MSASGRLAEFLHARRALLTPEDVGLPSYGERRRVPGLRREELAMLAGVSTSYYTRLEQGQSPNASPEVVDALARALRLDDDERRHLRDLATAKRERRAPRRATSEHVAPATAELLAALGDTPALVLGRRTDVLAWNPTGHALFAGHLDPAAPLSPADRPNSARLVFLDAHTRELYADWPAKARAVVGNLHRTAGQHPDDTALNALIGELSTRSREFAAMWADHRVRTCTTTAYEMRHPLVGAIVVNQQTLLPAHAEGQTITAVTAAAGSPAAEALALLARSVHVAEGAGDRAGRW
jgi:transcriptional regulator with XRE-family HTH domain